MAKVENASGDRTRKILLNSVGAVLAVFLLSIALAVFGGPRYNAYLRLFGIQIGEAGGVWMDCSKWENRNNRFCGGKEHPSEKEWKGVAPADDTSEKTYVPFSLGN